MPQNAPSLLGQFTLCSTEPTAGLLSADVMHAQAVQRHGLTASYLPAHERPKTSAVSGANARALPATSKEAEVTAAAVPKMRPIEVC